MADQPLGERQSLRFLWLYALAAGGGAVAYVPFLTLLLPMRAARLAEATPIDLLAYIAFAGAIAASLANIAFGWLSDVTGTRTPWILCGLTLSCALLVAMAGADTPMLLIGLIIAWQIALNMMLGPLAAWAGDTVPDAQKGLLGGLLAFAPALGAACGALVTVPGWLAPDLRLVAVAAFVAAMVLPVLLFGKPRPMPQLAALRPADPAAPAPASPRKSPAVATMWMARLLVQIAEAALFAYLLIWLTGLSNTYTDNATARLFATVLALSVPLAMVAGRWSDRHDRPLAPLVMGAGIGALGLVFMSLARTIEEAMLAYVVFGVSTGVFLALHASQTLRVLPRPANRGRDLGIFNLTNTVPSLVMPWLTLALVPAFGFSGLFLALAALCGLATALLLALPRLS